MRTRGNKSLDELFARLRNDVHSELKKGQRFERLMKAAFERHPGEYGPARFEEVWMWRDWPDRTKLGYLGQDTGVDLVAQQTEAYGGGLCAIQCKFYADSAKVPTQAVDSFLATSGTEHFQSRILVVTGEITNQAWTTIRKASPRCEVITTPDLKSWPVRWADFFSEPDALAFDPVRYEPFSFQAEAIERVEAGFEASDRGKLILPCGTGKSVVSLWIAERLVGTGGKVLYLVPSIALMGQTMREWARQRNPDIPHRYIGICSDPKAGRASADTDLSELAMPVTTDPERIGEQLGNPAPGDMTVVFCTYQSLPLIGEAQAATGGEFDLVICDEAHRTTGIHHDGDSAPGFRLIHEEGTIVARRRLFMTATPRIYTHGAKKKVAEAGQGKYGVYSMDDRSVYGPEFYRLDFADAIEAGHLADYKVVVIAVDEVLAGEIHGQVAPADGPALRMQDVVALAGCWDALADPTTRRAQGRVTGATNPDHAAGRAIAFTNTIATSKRVANWWNPVVSTAAGYLDVDGFGPDLLDCSVEHMDGKMNAYARAGLIDWLQEGGASGQCRVVTNAKVLTEGVDVPALDAILFIEPKTSQVDVVQAVGRVMRRSEGKEFGYVVIPVPIPEGAGLSDDKFLDSSEFKKVWSVLKALRSHDGRADVWINTADLGGAAPLTIRAIGDICDMCGERECPGEEDCPAVRGFGQGKLPFPWQNAVASKLVEKCGDHQYWDRWAGRVSEIADRIETLIRKGVRFDADLSQAFERFLVDMRRTVGGHVTNRSLTTMVAHHVVTLPVFDTLFSGSGFADRNPISKALNELLDEFKKAGYRLQDETAELDRFYQSVASRIGAAANSDARLTVMLDVYESFFRKAMPQQVKQLGITYTPVELVDFMLRSVDAVCRQEFGRGLSAPGVHILDPFTGTGTFINRLITQKGAAGGPLIEDRDLDRKFTGMGTSSGDPEIHANEIVLLAYYLAAIKIEEGYNERRGTYQPFGGILLTDTFEMTRATSAQLPGTTSLKDNTERTRRQNSLPIQVIIGNPPWSAGQKDAGEDNPNVAHPDIEARVKETYVSRHKQVKGRSPGGSAAGNLYVEAFRWASDRLGGQDRADTSKPGVLAFIHPNSLATGTSLAGMRATLRDEFTSIYVVNLRGDAYKSGEEYRREGDKLFGGGSRNGVQITVLVRNPSKDISTPAVLHYAEVPEYSSLEQKLAWLAELGDVTSPELDEIPITDHHDWVNLTDGTFDLLLPVCSGKTTPQAAISKHASGVKTNCDTYVYSFSRSDLIHRIGNLIDEYEYARHQVKSGVRTVVEATRNTNLAAIKWTDTLKQSLKGNKKIVFDESRIREVLYRPFTKLWLYEDNRILSSVKTISAMFPRDEEREREREREYSSPLRPAQPSSASSHPTGSGISSQQGWQQPAGTYHDTNRQFTDAPPPERSAILVPTQNNRDLFTGLAVRQISDLNCLGPNQGGARSLPKRRS